jgi:SNF2 family DNA or RNA helicase
LAENQSKHLGPLIGHIGSVSEPITLKALKESENKIYLRIFYVHPSMRTESFVHGFVFSRQSFITQARKSFQLANIMLKHIPSYDPTHFLGVQQTEDTVPPTAIEEDDRHTIPGCKTKLMDHQIKAIKFIRRSESNLFSTPLEIWEDSDNRWVHRVFEDAVRKGYLGKHIKFDAKGCILADDMGLGKTLTTLSVIQLSSEEALKFSRQQPEVTNLMLTSATLIICPLSTLENWKNEINTHFKRGSLPFKTYYGREKYTIEFKEIAQVAVVLATYESVSTQMKSSQPAGSSNDGEGRKLGLDFSRIKWFRIILDEAQ